MSKTVYVREREMSQEKIISCFRIFVTSRREERCIVRVCKMTYYY